MSPEFIRGNSFTCTFNKKRRKYTPLSLLKALLHALKMTTLTTVRSPSLFSPFSIVEDPYIHPSFNPFVPNVFVDARG